jgi:hypothetical protein
VSDDPSSFDHRITELQSQLDRLAVTLQLWREQQEHLKPAEDRLNDLTRRCTEIIQQWSATNDRQERAVGQLEERVSAFSSAEERLHQDAAQRLRTLERVIEQEWTGIRQLHQAPVRELREQAAALSQVSIAAANSSVHGLERAEARLAEIERTLHHHLSGVSQRLDAAVAEIRALAPAQTPALATEPAQVSGSQTWPIEGVVRLHNQLRESSELAGSGPPSLRTIAVSQVALPNVVPELESRLESVEQAIADRTEELRQTAEQGARTGRQTRFALGAIVLVLAGSIATGLLLRRDAQDAAARATNAQAQARAAAENATEQVSAARAEAAREVATAREEAARAQAVGDVIAAPDVVRYTVTGAGPTGVSGQVLWSRTRGVVFSGIRLPEAPPQMVYQLWLLNDGMPIDAGTFVPDSTGRVTYAAAAPTVPRPVTGAALTVEPQGGSRIPSDPSLIPRSASPENR